MDEKQTIENPTVSIWNKLLSIDRAMHTFVIGYIRKNKRILFPLAISFLFLAILALFLISVIYVVPAIQEISYRSGIKEKQTMNLVVDTNALKKQEKKLGRDIEMLEKKLDRKTPRSPYLIVNTSKNKFFLYKYKELIGRGKCSTGSYILLSNGEEQQWIFKTPKGIFTIKGKTTQPVWIKPDWAFVEEGLPIPPVAHSSRYEYGVLGDYALSLGHGYMIHGTLYQRFLGLPVTHGCIRLNDDDLKLVYQRLAIGSKVFIY